MRYGDFDCCRWTPAERDGEQKRRVADEKNRRRKLEY
jgi:hypothetical protein